MIDMNATANACIDGWDVNSPKNGPRQGHHEEDPLTMSAPAVLSLPEAAINSGSTISPSNTGSTTTTQPTPPPPDMNKILFASSPRSAKLMERVSLTDMAYIRAREKYNIVVPVQHDTDSTLPSTANTTTTTTTTTTKASKKSKDQTKGKEKKKNKQQLQNEIEEKWESSKLDFLFYYGVCCQKIGIPMDPLIQALMSRVAGKNETIAPVRSLRIDPNDPMPPLSEEEAETKKKKKDSKADQHNKETGGGMDKRDKRLPLGPGGCRALMSALAGGWVGSTNSTTTNDGQFVRTTKITVDKKNKTVTTIAEGYLYLEQLIIRSGAIKTIGTSSIAEYLACAKAAAHLKTLVLWNSGIGSAGAFAIGKSLRFGGNTTLTKLVIDVDTSLGNVGIEHLVRGLETNATLTDLSVCCCGFQAKGAHSLATLLKSAHSNIQILSLRGNTIGGDGLLAIAQAIGNVKRQQQQQRQQSSHDTSTTSTSTSTTSTPAPASTCKLVYLNVANIGINGSHLLELQAFGTSIVTCTTLKAIHFDYNCIGKEGGQALIDGWNGNAKNIAHVAQFVVSCSLPAGIFAQIYKGGGGGKTRGKKKKKKKKKRGNVGGGVVVPDIVPDLQLAIKWMAAAMEKRRVQEEENQQKKR